MKPSTAEITTVLLSEFTTPWGTLMLADLSGQIALCDWVNSPRFGGHLASLPARQLHKDSPLIIEAKRQIEEYIQHRRREFTLPLAEASTPFAAHIRQLMLAIPYGETVSYKRLAEMAGNPRAVRAVAHAVACNPLNLLVPCHRVIGTDGTLTGYAGGVSTKRSLLHHESGI